MIFVKLLLLYNLLSLAAGTEASRSDCVDKVVMRRDKPSASNVDNSTCSSNANTIDEVKNKAKEILRRIVVPAVSYPLAIACGSYLAKLGVELLSSTTNCFRYSTLMLVALDMSPNMPIFTGETETILYQKDTLQFMQDLSTDLDLGKVKNLWDWTLSHHSISDNKEKAILWLGILFQGNYGETKRLSQTYQCGIGPLWLAVYKQLVKAVRNKDTQPYPRPIDS